MRPRSSLGSLTAMLALCGLGMGGLGGAAALAAESARRSRGTVPLIPPGKPEEVPDIVIADSAPLDFRVPVPRLELRREHVDPEVHEERMRAAGVKREKKAAKRAANLAKARANNYY